MPASIGAQSQFAPVAWPVIAPLQNAAGTPVLPHDVRKQLLKVITAPTPGSWADLELEKWCLAMDRYLSITDLHSDQAVVLQLVWCVLPEHVRTVVVPIDPSSVASCDVADSLWDGLDQFPCWTDLKTANISHFRPLAQRKHVVLLCVLRFRPYASRQFRQNFLQILSKLEPAYTPNDLEVLAKLQASQHSRLATMPSVIMFQGGSWWLPAQWLALLNAMIDVDTALAETAQPGGPSPQPGPGSVATPKPSQGKGKGKRSWPGSNSLSPPERTSAGQKSVGLAGSPPAMGAAGSAKANGDRAERFRGLLWADPAVKRVADKGHCINCV